MRCGRARHPGQSTPRDSPQPRKTKRVPPQSKYLVSPSYMDKQTDINEKMRSILIDWLVEVHHKFKLVPETLYVTVNLIDRYLAAKPVTRNKLQLVGVTAMFIAAKYEEIYAPEVKDFVYISDKAYAREEILRMEAVMLATVNFNITAPSAYAFLQRFVKVAGFMKPDETREERLCSFLVELTLQEYRMVKYLPSVIAASAVCLAQKMLHNGVWVRGAQYRAPAAAPALTTAHVFLTQGGAMEAQTLYQEATLLPCMRDMNTILNAALAPKNNLNAVRKKYSREDHGQVALVPPVEL